MSGLNRDGRWVPLCCPGTTGQELISGPAGGRTPKRAKTARHDGNHAGQQKVELSHGKEKLNVSHWLSRRRIGHSAHTSTVRQAELGQRNNRGYAWAAFLAGVVVVGVVELDGRLLSGRGCGRSVLPGVVEEVEEDVLGDYPDAEGARGGGFP